MPTQATNTPLGSLTHPAAATTSVPTPAPASSTADIAPGWMEQALADLADDDRVDARIRLIASASVPDAKKARARVKTLQTLCEEGVLDLDPDHLSFARYIVNWDHFASQLPRKSRGEWVYGGTPLRMAEGIVVHYAEAYIPTRYLVGQLGNYRISSARNLRERADAKHPVSRAKGRTHGTRELATLVHQYQDPQALRSAFHRAHTDLIAARSKYKGWEPLLGSVQADGITDGGLWTQTIFELVDAHGHPLGVTSATLSPAEGHSRKAAADHTQDPDGTFAAVPIEQVSRSTLFGSGDITSPHEPAGQVETVMAPLVALRKQLAELARHDTTRPYMLGDLDDALRAQLNTSVILVRVVIAVERDGTTGVVAGPELFRAAQEHFHPSTHLGHTPTATQFRLADKLRDALKVHTTTSAPSSAASSGTSSETSAHVTSANLAADRGPIEWTPDLLAAWSVERNYAGLTRLGLNADRVGAAIAAYLLLTSAGPVRAVVGRALGSQPNAGAYDNVQAARRAGVLRELIFPENGEVNVRLFAPVNWSAAFEAPHERFNITVEELFDKYTEGSADAWEQGLFSVVAAVRAVEANIGFVDLGSKGQARGFLTAKLRNAVHGQTFTEEDQTRVHVPASPAGTSYTRALLSGNLLTRQSEPTPPALDGVPLPEVTTAQWEQWAAGGVGLLDATGQPVLRDVVAVVVDDDGRVVCGTDGGPAKTHLRVPAPAPSTVFDAFSTPALKKRAVELRRQGTLVAHTETTAEKFATALREAEAGWAAVQTGFARMAALTTHDSYVLDEATTATLERFVRGMRVEFQAGQRGVGDQCDAMIVASQTAREAAATAAATAEDMPPGWEDPEASADSATHHQNTHGQDTHDAEAAPDSDAELLDEDWVGHDGSR